MRAGCDLVRIDRIAGVLARRPAFRGSVFTEREQRDALRGGVVSGSHTEAERLAARFAAKEATKKALRRDDMTWTDVEVRTLPSGAPELWVFGERSELTVSLSHDTDHAMAFVVGPPPGVVTVPDASNNAPHRVNASAGRPLALAAMDL